MLFDCPAGHRCANRVCRSHRIADWMSAAWYRPISPPLRDGGHLANGVCSAWHVRSLLLDGELTAVGFHEPGVDGGSKWQQYRMHAVQRFNDWTGPWYRSVWGCVSASP